MLSKERIVGLFLIFFAVFSLISIKIFDIQIISHTKLYKQAASQRYTSVKLSDNRGIIYDRNLIPMVNNNSANFAVVFPKMIKDKSKVEKILKTITNGINIKKKMESKKSFSQQVSFLNEDIRAQLKRNNVLLVKGYDRYGAENLARHIIGYTAAGDGHGRAGIEKTYDQFLFSTQGKYLGVVSDAVHRSINGLGVRFVNQRDFNGELDVQLTLDYHIQKVVEDSMDKHGISGAVVALKVDNGDVLAMASRPQFNQLEIEKHVESGGSELVNRALSAYNVGSVFKIIVAAAAFENNVTSLTDTFNCAGYKKIQNRVFACNSKHGTLDLKKAFAVSCNSTFIDLGLRTGENNILDMAKKFGYGEGVLSKEVVVNEGVGNLPASKYKSDKETANISIGQGDILATPVQVASMIATVANGGVRTNVNLVNSIIDSNGQVVKKIRSETQKKIISSYTAGKLRTMMREVTASGTGKKADIPEYGGSAGKTGTAQTGWMQGDKTKTHAWFAGFFPVDKPQYALVVLAENGQSGANVAAPLFGEIATGIMKLGKR